MADNGSGRWSGYCSCSLCANKSPTFGGDDHDAAAQAAEAWAAANGWLALPERSMLVGPRRFAGHICRACVIDLRRLLYCKHEVATDPDSAALAKHPDQEPR
jgi:hypothetical protein